MVFPLSLLTASPRFYWFPGELCVADRGRLMEMAVTSSVPEQGEFHLNHRSHPPSTSRCSPFLPTGHKTVQHRAALDVTESALLRPCFPGVKYLRMDGSVSQAERAAAVDRFSADPSVAILLLTTRVGHLGLNLSAASMVVFLEHDWNPQVDLQVRGVC